MDYVWLVVGLALVALGAEFLVRGAVALAARFGVPPLLVGLTIVAWGTSTPELVVSVEAALKGSSGLAVGNVVGSNIFNILAILGVAAMLAPIPSPRREAIVRDGIVGLGASAALFLFARANAEISLRLGLGLLVMLALYMLFVFVQERLHFARSARAAVAERVEQRHPLSVWAGAFSVAAGLSALIYGASLLVNSGVSIARSWGVSETVIGLTLIAGGTSLPELATSSVAALRRQGDIAIGNVLGSNIYNILAILGIAAVIKPLPVPQRIVAFDLPALIAVSLFLLMLLLFERRVGRLAGLTLFAAFVSYIYLAYRGL